MAEHYDVAIIGAGHNGLVAATYLARAGCKVGVFEARHIVGGACVTEELIAGAKWSSCAFVQGLFRDEIVAELELKKHGLEMYAPDVQGFALFDDGVHLFLWKELDRTLREIEKHSKHDAERFIEFGARYRRFGEIMKPFMFDVPPLRSELFAAFEAAGAEDLLDEFVLGSTNDLLDRYFESDHIKGFLTFYGMVSVWGGPSTPGLAYVYGIPVVLGWLGLSGQTTAYNWAFAVVSLLVWPYSAWVYRTLYIKPVRQAMRDHGYDLCISCGYELRGLGDEVERCPECGSSREAMPKPKQPQMDTDQQGL